MDRGEVKTIIERNLASEFPPFMDQALIKEFYKHPEAVDEEGNQLLKYANTIFDELNNADVIVMGTPMHNLTISAPLKAWIDQFIRFGVTYQYDNAGLRTGFFKHKKLYLVIASGGRLAEWPNGNEYIESYIKMVFSAYAGITDISTFRIEGTAAQDFKGDYGKIIQNL